MLDHNNFPGLKMFKEIALSVFVVATYGTTQAAPVFFIDQPSANFSNWAASVIASGGAINSNVNFDGMSTGALQSSFYTVSDGVTLTASGGFNTVVSGAGPGQSSVSNSQAGEGTHADSNYLQGSAGVKSLTISFSDYVLGVTLGTIDKFGFGSTTADPMTLTAFGGIEGTGTNLGSATVYDFLNFQVNNMFYMGVSDATNQIRSVVFTYAGTVKNDDIGIDNIAFATITSTSVPEPTTVALIGLGLLGVVASRNKSAKGRNA